MEMKTYNMCGVEDAEVRMRGEVRGRPQELKSLSGTGRKLQGPRIRSIHFASRIPVRNLGQLWRYFCLGILHSPEVPSHQKNNELGDILGLC